MKPGLIIRPSPAALEEIIEKWNPEYHSAGFLAYLLKMDPKATLICLDGSSATLDPDAYMRLRGFFGGMRISRSTILHNVCQYEVFEHDVVGQIEIPKPLFKKGQQVYVDHVPRISGRKLKGVQNIQDLQPRWLLDPAEFNCWTYRFNEAMSWRYIPEASLQPTLEAYR